MRLSLKHSKIRIVVGGGSLFAAGILLAACGNSGGGTSNGAAAAPPASAVGKTTSSVIVSNGHLTNSAGRTIYLFEADSNGKSACNGTCARYWPPVASSAKAGAGVSAASISTIKRSGGTQLAYAGHPLYYFAKDTAAGQANGQGVNFFGGTWWEVSPAGKAFTSKSGGNPSPSSSASSKSGGGYVY